MIGATGWMAGDKRNIGQPGEVKDITPSDDTVYDPPLWQLRVHTSAGDVQVMYASGRVQVLHAVQLYYEYTTGPITKVMLTNTTATGIEGVYYPAS